MNTYISMAIGILKQADRKEMTVPERRLYDAAMESWRYLPQAELICEVEATAKQINFRNPMERTGAGYVDFAVANRREQQEAARDLAKWKDKGWEAELIREEKVLAITGKRITEFMIRIRRQNECCL